MRILFEVVKYHEQGFMYTSVKYTQEYTIEMQGRGDLNFKLIVDLEFENSTGCVNSFSPFELLGIAIMRNSYGRFDAQQSFLNLSRTLFFHACLKSKMQIFFYYSTVDIFRF